MPEGGFPFVTGAAAKRLHLVLMRPEDNLVLVVSGEELAVQSGDGGVPRLIAAAGAAGSRLIVTCPPQHVAEQVYQEHVGQPGPDQPVGQPETPSLPAGSRFAAPTRLAFVMTAGDQVVLTIEGILAAMSRLPMAVVPLAAPRRIWDAWLASTGIAEVPAGALAMAGTVPAVGQSGQAAARDRIRAARILAASGLTGAVRNLTADQRRALLAAPAADRLALATSPAVLAGIDHRTLVGLLRNPDPRPPLADETAIEVPSRLQLSPSVDGAWAHATTVADERGDGGDPVELWHTRLGVRDVAQDGTVTVNEQDASQRNVRGVWTRDLTTWSNQVLPPDNDPFTMSTAPGDRRDIVALSTGAGRPFWASPDPVEVDHLFLSSLGAFIDVRGAWTPYEPYHVKEWYHRTTLGRDQYVKVVYPGYLYPLGHRAPLVKETRRKVDPDLPDSADHAILWQRWYVARRDRIRSYDGRDMPFTSAVLDPPSTPDLDAPDGNPPDYFWPSVAGEPFAWTVSGVDQDGATHVFHAPLLWVAAPMAPGTAPGVLAAYGLAKDAQGFRQAGNDDPKTLIDLAGKRIAVAPSGPSGDAAYETRTLRFAGDPAQDTVAPTLLFADLVIPAVAAATGTRTPQRFGFAAPYLSVGLDDPANAGEVVLQTARDITPGALSFTGSTDRSGGFLDPSQVIDGVSRKLGPVADVASTALGSVDPGALFAGMGKLFGLFDLADILKTLGLGDMPGYASRVLDIAGALDGDLSRLPSLLPDAPAQVAAAKTALLDATQALDALMNSPPADLGTATAQFQTLIDTQLKPAITQAASDAVISQLGKAQQAIAARALDTLSNLLTPPVALPLSPADMLARIAAGQSVASVLTQLHLEWSPPLQEFPGGAPIFKPELAGKGAGALLLAVDVRGGDLVPAPSAQVVAQLTNFTLQLLPGAPLLGIGFERLMFKATSGAKADVDVAIDDLAWQGILGFVERLKDLIPLDGFSDPPNIEVSPSGITAGFSAGLPNLAVGVFNLSNLSLGADLQLPFIGTAPTVGFAFCSRERPFALAVMFLGGGGFFGLRLNPRGLVLLEASLEFGACLALDFGVASGSVSVMAGIYLRLEASDGSLTGYLRIRGDVEVLGLISASIEMYMGLTYEFGSGKVIGRATITVEVEVLLFSASVQISCERKFAGSSGDPTFAQVMGPYADDGPWVTYCQAFAEV